MTYAVGLLHHAGEIIAERMEAHRTFAEVVEVLHLLTVRGVRTKQTLRASEAALVKEQMSAASKNLVLGRRLIFTFKGRWQDFVAYAIPASEFDPSTLKLPKERK